MKQAVATLLTLLVVASGSLRAQRRDLVPRMPAVDTVEDFATVVARARGVSAGDVRLPGEESVRFVALITPGRSIPLIPTPDPGTASAEQMAWVRSVVPETTSQLITVVAFNDVVMANALTPGDIRRLIPFLGLLIGLAYVGHNVIVFEGHPSAFVVACRNADLLMVDEAMIPFLQKDWRDVARAVMRRPRLLTISHDEDVRIVEMPDQR